MEMTRIALEIKHAEIDTQINQLVDMRQQTVTGLQNIEVQLIKLQGQRELLGALLKSLDGVDAST
jgi:hypothetical protein